MTERTCRRNKQLIVGGQNIFYSILLLVVGCAASASDAADNPTIAFYLGEEALGSYSLIQMQGEIIEHRIQIHDIYYQKDQEYRAFQLCDLLQLGFGGHVAEAEDGSVFFIALDGYEASADRARLCEDDAYLVFAMAGGDDWEMLPKYNAMPGPFYLVWSDSNKTPEDGYPWPWQISAIRWASFETTYSSIVPNDLATDSPAYSGFELFRTLCIGCHAIAGNGGVVGPGLEGILGYRSEEMVRAFIKAPSQFRLSRMPDFDHISAVKLDQLIAYFKYLDATNETDLD